MRIGCCAPIEKYEQIASDGYDYIEFPGWQLSELSWDELYALATHIERTGLPCLRLNAYCKADLAIVGPRFDRDAVRSYAEKLMKYASALHVQCVGIGSPGARQLPEGFDRALADRQCEEFLTITAQEAAPYGIQILLEAVQSGMCNYLNTTSHAKELVQRLSLDNVSLVVDLYNMETQGEDWGILGSLLPWTRHIHISTVGPGISRGLYGVDDMEYCRRTFSAIAKSGYQGTVSVEPDAKELKPNASRLALTIMRDAAAMAD